MSAEIAATEATVSYSADEASRLAQAQTTFANNWANRYRALGYLLGGAVVVLAGLAALGSTVGLHGDAPAVLSGVSAALKLIAMALGLERRGEAMKQLELQARDSNHRAQLAKSNGRPAEAQAAALEVVHAELRASDRAIYDASLCGGTRAAEAPRRARTLTNLASPSTPAAAGPAAAKRAAVKTPPPPAPDPPPRARGVPRLAPAPPAPPAPPAEVQAVAFHVV